MADLRDDDEDDLPEPPRLRALRRLVTALTATLILGMLAVAGTLVVRLARPEAPAAPAFAPQALTAERLVLPAGEAITALGAAGPALAVATRDGRGAERIRLFDPATGAELGAVAVERAP
jgi:hypothetical protein